MLTSKINKARMPSFRLLSFLDCYTLQQTQYTKQTLFLFHSIFIIIIVIYYLQYLIKIQIFEILEINKYERQTNQIRIILSQISDHMLDVKLL